MSGLRITARAEAELRGISSGFFEPWQRAEAGEYTIALVEAMRAAARAPMRSPALDPRDPSLRIGRSGSHRFLFKVRPQGILVTRVVHVRQNFRGNR